MFGGKDGACNGAGHTRFDRHNWGRERRKYYFSLKESKPEKIARTQTQELGEELDDFCGEELYISYLV